MEYSPSASFRTIILPFYSLDSMLKDISYTKESHYDINTYGLVKRILNIRGRKIKIYFHILSQLNEGEIKKRHLTRQSVQFNTIIFISVISPSG